MGSHVVCDVGHARAWNAQSLMHWQMHEELGKCNALKN